MSDYGTMQTRIADELDRTDLTTQITKAIQSAVKHYEKQRFWFNEQRSLSFATIASQEFYGATENSNIPNLLFVDVAKIAYSATDKNDLDPKPYDELERLSNNGTEDEGQPTSFAHYAKQIRLYPIPDASYSVNVSGVFSLGELSVSADTNNWMTDGEALIRLRAKWDIYTNVIKDVESASMMKSAEREELSDMISATNSRKSTGKIRGTQF